MAKKKSNQQQVEIRLAEIRGEAPPGQPQMVWPLVLTASGAGVVLKGAELGAKGIAKVIEAKALPPLQFEIRDSWLEDEREHRVKIHIRNTTKNGIYIESFDIKREYLDPNEIDQNRTTQPTVSSGSEKIGIGDDFNKREPPVFEYPLLLSPENVGVEQVSLPKVVHLSLPKVDRKKMKSERAVATVQYADLGKEKSDTISFDFRLRWHPRPR